MDKIDAIDWEHAGYAFKALRIHKRLWMAKRACKFLPFGRVRKLMNPVDTNFCPHCQDVDMENADFLVKRKRFPP